MSHSSFIIHHSSLPRAPHGITLLELIILLAVAGVIVFIALPTLHLNEEEAVIESAKDDLRYLYDKEQAYFQLHGKYAPFRKLAADPQVGRDFDTRFGKADRPVVDGTTFIGPPAEIPVLEITAILPQDKGRYKIDQRGEITALQ